MADTTNSETYEELYARLQDVVARLEQGEMPLEESLKLYEQGIALAEKCQRLLDTAEMRVQQLQVGARESGAWKE